MSFIIKNTIIVKRKKYKKEIVIFERSMINILKRILLPIDGSEDSISTDSWMRLLNISIDIITIKDNSRIVLELEHMNEDKNERNFRINEFNKIAKLLIVIYKNNKLVINEIKKNKESYMKCYNKIKFADSRKIYGMKLNRRNIYSYMEYSKDINWEEI